MVPNFSILYFDWIAQGKIGSDNLLQRKVDQDLQDPGLAR
jgi:hypothetical protein